MSVARSAGRRTARAGCEPAAGGGDGRRAGVNSPERRRRLGEGADMAVGGGPLSASGLRREDSGSRGLAQGV